MMCQLSSMINQEGLASREKVATGRTSFPIQSQDTTAPVNVHVIIRAQLEYEYRRFGTAHCVHLRTATIPYNIVPNNFNGEGSWSKPTSHTLVDLETSKAGERVGANKVRAHSPSNGVVDRTGKRGWLRRLVTSSSSESVSKTFIPPLECFYLYRYHILSMELVLTRVRPFERKNI
eukprot:scaffold1799_cov191-Amphora_coffeaeformis.AAC.6